ncbi:MAG: hypothetical protein ABIT01_13450 [Thermoanaerobaculia bacterium]
MWSDHDRWRRERGIDRKITGYSVDAATLEAGADPLSAIVSCTIEGQKLKMRVPKENYLSRTNEDSV